jgi:hypothetical protein
MDSNGSGLGCHDHCNEHAKHERFLDYVTNISLSRTRLHGATGGKKKVRADVALSCGLTRSSTSTRVWFLTEELYTDTKTSCAGTKHATLALTRVV